MELFQWLFRLYQRFTQSILMIFQPLNYDNQSTMAGGSSDWPVHQLWPPSEGNQRTELDVVFIHGLQLTANDTSDAWSSTWTQRGHDDVCWPRDWLPYDLGQGQAVRIFSVSYNADIVTCPHDHVSEIAHNLSQNLMNPRYEWDHPIVLIGHSFGGLVLKSLVVQLNRASTNTNLTDSWSISQQESAKVFMSNVRGVAFYAVPHAGSNNIRKYVIKLLKCNRRDITGIMRNIHPRQGDMEQLSVDFGRIVTDKEISIYAFCEGRPMEQMGILVDETSARRAAEDNFYKIEDADHVEVCKPPSKEHSSYVQLLQFIITCGKVARECDQPLQEVHDLPESTFGLESYVERVETLVTSEGSDAAPRYVGVWGMGGLGKTLLLQRLYGSPNVHGHFQGAKFIWLTVGQTPDIMALYWTLSAELGLKPEKTANPEDYKVKLYNQFRQRRVFLVLDDVWQDKTFNSLDLAKGKGSVTLLSTRNLSLLQRASPQISQVQMAPLSKEDSWSLFCVHAFTPPSNVPDEVKEYAESMAQECKGLPLALKVIGRAMFGKDSCEWELLLKKLRESRMQENTVEEELYEHLKLGYDLLSEVDSRLQRCFHYFAAFPEDSNIVFEEILFHWTGEGLVPEHNGDDPRADAFSLLKKLWLRSFIESKNGQLSSNQCYLLNFKVHDVMRDLALYLLKKDCGTPSAKELYLYRAGQNLEEIPREWKGISEPPESKRTTILEARRLSLDTNKFETLPEFYAPKLVFLLLGGNPIISLPADFSSYFPKLSVLNLRKGQFHSLPDELGDLKNLVCLDLSNCHELETLPVTVSKLQKLKFLILNDCWALKYLPSGMVNLTSLQVLHTARCVRLNWAEHTLSRTSMEEFRHFYRTDGASLEDICGLLLLKELTIFAEKVDIILEMCKLPQNMLPPNISSLTKLKLLQIWLNIETLPAEMSFRCIQLQELEICSSVLKHLPPSFTRCGAFPALTKLKLSCVQLVEFPEVEKDALPTLRTLDLTSCSSLKVLSPSIQLLTKLSSLIVEYCDESLKNSCRENCEKSLIWRNLDIQFTNKQILPLEVLNSKRYTFGVDDNHDIEFRLMNADLLITDEKQRVADFGANYNNRHFYSLMKAAAKHMANMKPK